MHRAIDRELEGRLRCIGHVPGIAEDARAGDRVVDRPDLADVRLAAHGGIIPTRRHRHDRPGAERVEAIRASAATDKIGTPELDADASPFRGAQPILAGAGTEHRRAAGSR
jgi:hypothetical protein